MTKKEFTELVLDEQRKWGASPGTVLIEEREFVKLPKSEGKSEPVEKVDPLARITDAMYLRLSGGSQVAIPPTAHRTLSESQAPQAIPAGMHKKLAEAIDGHGPALADGMHEKMAKAFSGNSYERLAQTFN